MNTWWALAIIWATSALGMAALWAFSMRVRNVGYVDVGWAGLMALAALFAGVVGEGSPLVRSLVAMFGSLWGARLCLHLLHRVLNEDEDGRYRALREAWNGSQARFFAFFQLQALVVALFSLPFLAAAANPAYGFNGWVLLAIVVWTGSMAGESLADRQLAQFRADPANRGKTCRAGLWGWSRHPNYFFEWLHWFSYVLLAVGSGLFWLSLLGPVVMFAFLYRVSGIPWTEAQSLRSRGEDYARYQREVSAFFPWPPRRKP
jgi:steroid 5-alpha reductase family enzyme